MARFSTHNGVFLEIFAHFSLDVLINRGYYTVERRYEFYVRVRYCSCHENIKFISSSQRVMFFLLYGETNSTKAKGGNRDVIERYDTHKGDIRKIRHSGPG